MDLSIVIVNYKSKNKLSACLQSLEAAAISGLAWEIILVDNNSGDDLQEFLGLYKNSKLILSPKNLGMGGGNNLGIEAAQGKYILILNPDTVVRSGAIEKLISYLQVNAQVGIVGPKLLNPDNSLQYSCLRFPGFFMPILRRTFLGKYFKDKRDYFQMSEFDHENIQEVDWLLGSALLFKKEITLVDGKIWKPRFDERYFMYFEDTDLCRTAHNKGLKVVYYSEAILIHDHARQSAKYPWYQAIFCDALARHHIRSWLTYFWKGTFK